MASAAKLSMLWFLLLTGVVIFGDLQKNNRVEACPQYCLDVAYVTCASSGETKLPARCNCCLAPHGCTLHLSDGTQNYCP